MQTFEEFEAKNVAQLKNALTGKITALFDEEHPMPADQKTELVLDLVTHLAFQIISHYNNWLNGIETTDGPPAGAPPPGGPPPQEMTK